MSTSPRQSLLFGAMIGAIAASVDARADYADVPAPPKIREPHGQIRKGTTKRRRKGKAKSGPKLFPVSGSQAMLKKRRARSHPPTEQP